VSGNELAKAKVDATVNFVSVV